MYQPSSSLQIVVMNILVGNLNNRTTAQHLLQLFFPFGVVQSVKILRDNITGQSTCLALVIINFKAGMMAIHQLNNLKFMDHYLDVYEADA